MSKHKKIIKRYKPLPPHTWKEHSTASAGEINKPLMIAIITVFVLGLLSLFLFFQEQIVGKAFETGRASLGLGGTTVERTFTVGQVFSVPLRANLGPGKQTVALGFRINLPAGLTCANLEAVPFQNQLGWNSGVVIDMNSCANGVAVFRMGTINPRLAVPATAGADFIIANLQFRNNVPAGNYNLRLSDAEIIDFSSHLNLGITDSSGREIIINQPAAQCTDGLRNGAEIDVDCGGTSNCPRCVGGQVCTAGSDCLTAVCTGGRCAATLCSPQSRQTCGPTDCASVGQGVWNTVASTCDAALIDVCTTNAQCTTTGLRVCDTAATPNRCVQCLTRNDCPAGAPVCNTALNTCGATSAEECNGVDDDGDGIVDEGLDSSITCGIGFCQNGGSRSCTNGQWRDSCTPNVAIDEVPAANNCNDGIDNDCDGTTDAADASCSVVPVCGNNRIDSGDTCDGNSQTCRLSNGYAGTQRCNAQCSGFDSCVATERCGDGVRNGPEQCDDGNTANGDGCSSSCQTGQSSCSASSLSACTTRTECEAQQGIYDITGTAAVCRAATCSDRVTLCTTEATCRTARGIWSENRCRAPGACSATNLIGCTTDVTCVAQNGVWDSTGTIAECRAPRCTNTVPANANLCSNDDQGLTTDTPRRIVSTCTVAKCEYTCTTGYRLENGVCVSIPTAQCTGSVPSNAQLCSGDDTAVSSDTARRVVASCTAAKCEYTCNSGYVLRNGACVLEDATKLFKTRISVGEGLPAGTLPTATVYTYLKDDAGRIVVFKKEIMTGVAVYEAIVHYQFPGTIKTKEVVVEDYPPGDSRRTFYGKLVVDAVANTLNEPAIESQTNGRKRLIFDPTVQN